jgi:hypothetical protein
VKISTFKRLFSEIFIVYSFNNIIFISFFIKDIFRNLNSLYSKVEPTKANPLIILIDEVDIIFNKITIDLFVQHKSIPTEVHDKITWNRLMDHIQAGIYPNVILVLTSNLTRSEICSKYDNSFIRPGRVDSFHNLHKKMNELSSSLQMGAPGHPKGEVELDVFLSRCSGKFSRLQSGEKTLIRKKEV